MTGRRALRQKLWRDLWHLRSQMLAVAVVMACGIAMFVTLRSMHGWLRETQRAYYEAYRFADVFAFARRAPLSAGRALAAIPGVAAVRTRIVRDVTVDLPGLAEPGTGRLVSLPETEGPMVNGVHLRRGRWIGARTAEVLLSEAFARANALAPGDSLAAIINGRRQWLRIVGTGLAPEYIYEIRGLGDVFPDSRRFGVIWIGERALAAAFQMQGAFNDAVLTLTPGASVPEALAAVDRILAHYGGTGAYARDDQLSHRFVSSEIEETRVTSILLPSIFLGVTAFLLHIVLARLVATQREQLGVLKAFGYANQTVALHYLGLASGPLLVGTLLGVAAGLWLAGGLAEVYARFYQFPDAAFHPDWGVVAAAFVVSAGAGLLGALSAVARAAALPPAEAMRPAAPPAFRRGLLDRLGLEHRLAPTTRILVRTLERRPVRTGLSVLGIGLATAIVMTGWGLFDAVEVMKDIQFRQVDRSDAMVVFETPRSAQARFALERLEGVRRAEDFHAVPVRLRHEHRTQRASLIGLRPDGELQRLVDRTGTARSVPAGGVMLSSLLARLLGVRAGDSVTVEVLEGRRPVRVLPITATSDDIIGTSVTMSLPGLRMLLDEGEVASGAFLRVDPLHEVALYAQLKRMPAVGGVVVREAVIRGFEETIAESFWISITTMVAFASVIAAGIVYNGARVSLSERGRELASLRVLGFSRREVTRLLLGEQALLTLAGLPLGVLGGYGLILLITRRFESDLFRMPMITGGRAHLFAIAVVSAAALLSSLAIRGRIARQDLVAVLKTRE